MASRSSHPSAPTGMPNGGPRLHLHSGVVAVQNVRAVRQALFVAHRTNGGHLGQAVQRQRR